MKWTGMTMKIGNREKMTWAPVEGKKKAEKRKKLIIILI